MTNGLSTLPGPGGTVMNTGAMPSVRVREGKRPQSPSRCFHFAWTSDWIIWMQYNYTVCRPHAFLYADHATSENNALR